MSAAPDARVLYYPRGGGGNAESFAQNVVDIWQNTIIPMLELDATLDCSEGATVPTDVDKNMDAFESWLRSTGRLNDTGVNHVYVVDDPTGHNSHAGTNDIKTDQDAVAFWNAGKSNLRGSDFAYNAGIHEALHNMMRTIDCPGDNKSNSNDHTCGAIYERYDTSEVTPVITNYVNGSGAEVGNSCNGDTTTDNTVDHIRELASCTESSVENWISIHF